MITSFGSIEVSEKVIQTLIPASAGIYIIDGNTGFPFTRE